MKRFIIPAMIAFAAILSGCSPKHYSGTSEQDIVILFDNDVHCAVDGYSRMATLRKEYKAEGNGVLTLSAGDFIQGGSLGAASKGKYIIDIMNQVGYDAVTLGNHEFDYGIPRLNELASEFNTPIVCCNLKDLATDKLMFEPYRIFSFGKTDIAVVGIATPYSFISSTPSYFQNDKGEYVYSLCADCFYETVQSVVDDARNAGAEYVITVTHLGDDAFDEINSQRMIANTHGIDAVLDGHSHSTVPARYLRNDKGEETLMTSTGSSFATIGKVTISAKGEFKSELLPVKDIDRSDAAVEAVIARVREEYESRAMRKIGICEALLPVADEDGPRAVRYREMGIGNFCTDAIRESLRTDIAVLGGGSIRAKLAEGDVTFNDIFTVFPFGNTVATASMTGQQILDLLEFSVYVLPVEFGGFLQVSGLKFDVDVQTDSPCAVDVNKSFDHFTGPERRVRNVQVMSADGSYSPIDTGRSYSVAGSAYLLISHGDGFNVIPSEVKVTDTGMIDVDLLEKYIVENLSGKIPERYSLPEGRINIVY